MHFENYPFLGGTLPETAALRNVLAFHGVTAPHTGEPFTEAMLLGLGNGLGAVYILWEFKEHNSKTVVMAFHHRANYRREFSGHICNRLGVTHEMHETSGRKAATAKLQAALDDGLPAIALVDWAGMSYLGLPEHLQGAVGYIVTVCGGCAVEGEIYIDDRSPHPLALSAEEFAIARGRIGSFKHQLLVLEPPVDIDLPNAVHAGIQSCLDYLGQKSDSFSLPSIRKFARMLTDRKNKKGWPQVFADRLGLFGVLRSLYETIEPVGANGGSLRAMYGDFLEEAAVVLNNPALAEVSAQYHVLGEKWHKLAESLLSNRIPEFKQAKSLIRKRRTMFTGKRKPNFEQIRANGNALEELTTAFDKEFPLEDSAITELFEGMQTQLFDIYESEVAALAALRAEV